jgi:hypothetical protein
VFSTTKHSWQKLTVLSGLAGLIYNSWPLGYWLNPIVARRGLASELEGLHQPYNWLFIGGDVVSSLLIGLAAIAIWPKVRHSAHHTLLKWTLWNIGGFGLFTTVDALLPLHCDPSISQCPNFIHAPLLLTHGVVSILASVCLFISLVLIWWPQRHNRLLQLVGGGYVLFSLFSLIAIFTPGQSNWSQHYYLLLCGVWLALVPLAVHDLLKRQSA